mmetsp:Transcript_363/g.658  ORF Transcript_363/g.658 Transcript_363/m.658 type:complete len:256 (+) Transcript_363:150-917(+)
MLLVPQHLSHFLRQNLMNSLHGWSRLGVSIPTARTTMQLVFLCCRRSSFFLLPWPIATVEWSSMQYTRSNGQSPILAYPKLAWQSSILDRVSPRTRAPTAPNQTNTRRPSIHTPSPRHFRAPCSGAFPQSRAASFCPWGVCGPWKSQRVGPFRRRQIRHCMASNLDTPCGLHRAKRPGRSTSPRRLVECGEFGGGGAGCRESWWGSSCPLHSSCSSSFWKRVASIESWPPCWLPFLLASIVAIVDPNFPSSVPGR